MRVGKLLLTIIFLCSTLTWAGAQRPSSQVVDPGVITTRQTITPAGIQAVFAGQVFAVGFCGSDTKVTILNDAWPRISGGFAAVHRFDLSSNEGWLTKAVNAQFGIQGMACVPNSDDILLAATERGVGKASQFVMMLTGKQLATRDSVSKGPSSGTSGVAAQTDQWQTAARFTGQLPTGAGTGSGAIGAIGISANGQVGVVALTRTDEAAVLDIARRKIINRIHVWIAPFTAVVNKEGTITWVSNWGGRVAKKSDLTAPTGAKEGADQVVIDKRGIASTGTLSRIDLESGQMTDEVAVGLHPTSLAWDEERGRLFAANGNSDSVSVVNTKTNKVIATWDLQPFAQRVTGIAPTALALTPDGQTLYITCGGINAVAVVRTSDGSIEGLIPTGWYPSHIAVSPNGKKLAVGTLLGIGSGQVPDSMLKLLDGTPALKDQTKPRTSMRYVHAGRGTAHIIDTPDATQLAAYTRAVIENNHLSPNVLLVKGIDAQKPRPGVKSLPVPERRGESIAKILSVRQRK